MSDTCAVKQALPVSTAVARIVRESGRQFDPQVVDSLKNKLPRMIEVRNIISDELEGIHDLDFTPAGAGADRDDARTGSATTGASG